MQGCIGSRVCGRLAERRKFQKSAGKCTTCPTLERSVVSTTRPSLSRPICSSFSLPNIPGRMRSTSLVVRFQSRAKSSRIESQAPLISTQSSPNGRRFDHGSTFCIRVVRQRRVSTSSSNSRATSSRPEKPHITSRPVPGTGMEPLNPSPLNIWKPSGESEPFSKQ